MFELSVHEAFLQQVCIMISTHQVTRIVVTQNMYDHSNFRIETNQTYNGQNLNLINHWPGTLKEIINFHFIYIIYIYIYIYIYINYNYKF